jgi:hypothetical protein
MLMRQQMAGCCHRAGGVAGLDWATCGSANCVTAYQAATEAWGQTRAIAPPSLIFRATAPSSCPSATLRRARPWSARLHDATGLWSLCLRQNHVDGSCVLGFGSCGLWAVGCGLRAAGGGLVRALAMQPCFASHSLQITAVTIQIKPSCGYLALSSSGPGNWSGWRRFHGCRGYS